MTLLTCENGKIAVQGMARRRSNAPGRGRHLARGARVAERTCTAKDCGSPLTRRDAKGLCNKHYKRLRTRGTTDDFPRTRKRAPVRDRILRNTAIQATGCVEWTGSTYEATGYGRIWVTDRSVQAHRAVYELLVGPIPEGLTLDHLCRNVSCVAPAHLEPVTMQVNTLRGTSPVAVNAVKTTCRSGHLFDVANTYHRPDGARGCRRCRLQASQRHRAKKERP